MFERREMSEERSREWDLMHCGNETQNIASLR